MHGALGTMNDSLSTFKELIHLVARLRGPEGCPWDKEQTWHSLLPYTIEEAYEVAEAVETSDTQGLKDELGDLLFHIVFYSQIAQEETLFSLEDVIHGVITKMTRRHPHVFGPQEKKPLKTQEVIGLWEEIKQCEKRQKTSKEAPSTPPSILDGIDGRLPALLWAAKVQRKMGQIGFDWKNADGVMEKVREEMTELDQARQDQDQSAMEEELGDVLFTLVNLAQHMKINPEMALRQATRKCQRRFRTMETLLHPSGQSIQDVSLEQLESLWQEAKSIRPRIHQENPVR